MSVSNFLIRTAKKVTSLNKTIENTAQIIFLSLLKKSLECLFYFWGTIPRREKYIAMRYWSRGEPKNMFTRSGGHINDLCLAFLRVKIKTYML